VSDKEKAKKREKLSSPGVYSLGMLGMTLPGQMYSSYKNYFYATKLNLSLRYISIGTIFFAVWDAFNDPIMGYISDRTRTRLGRRRPWLLMSAPLFAVFCILFFSVPNFVVQRTLLMAIYFTVFLMLTETTGTIISTNYFALFPELFVEQNDRAKANALRQALELVGMIIGVSLVPTIADAIGYQMTAVILCIIGMGLMYVTTIFSKEDPAHYTSSMPKLKDSLGDLARNRNFWSYGLATLFYQGASALCLSAIPFYVNFSLGESDSGITLVTGVIFVLAIPMVFVWSRVSLKLGALKTWRLCLLLFGLAFLPLLFCKTLVLTVILGSFVGIGLAGIIATMDLVIARIIDEDAEKTGLHREAIYQSVISFLIRFSSLFQTVTLQIVVRVYGFESAEVPGPNPAGATRFMLCIVPPILMLCSYLLSFIAKFSEEKAGERVYSAE